MKIDLSKEQTSEVSFVFDKQEVSLKFAVAETGNLYFVGTIDKYPVLGFIYKGEEKLTLGGSIIKSDALGKRDMDSFIEVVCRQTRFNGYRPDTPLHGEEPETPAPKFGRKKKAK